MIYFGTSDERKKITKDVIDHRERIRSVYRGEDGERILFNLLNDSGVFSVQTDPAKIATRNQAILWMEEMGMLDENRVRLFIHQFLEGGMASLETEDMNAQAAADASRKTADFGVFGDITPPEI